MKHCLIIDPSPIIRKVATIIAKDLGYRVEEAESEEIALAHCRMELPDVIFVDWRLPNGGALLFLDQLRGFSRVRKPRVIVLSTADDPAIFKAAQAAGADELMLKPFDRQALASSLGRVPAAA